MTSLSSCFLRRTLCEFSPLSSIPASGNSRDRMGVPIFKVRHLVESHNVKVYSSNYALYGDMSQRVMGVLQGFTPDVEIYSIDEAFMLLGGCRRGTPRELGELGREIKSKVRRDTGVPVTVG